MKRLILFSLLAFGATAMASDDAQITFQTTTLAGDPVLWRLQGKTGAVPENLSLRFDALASPALPGRHYGPITVSPDGLWYVFRSERFDPDSQGYAGTTIASSDLSSVETIRASGQTIHDQGLLAQATPGGTAVVYVDGGGPHTRDLFVVRRVGATWSDPVLLTGQSTFDWNYWPVLSPDGTKVAFDAGADSFPSTAIGEVKLDGTGFRVLVTKDDGPPGSATSTEAHSPAYAPDGSLLFEAEWGGSEQIWRRTGSGVPVLLQPAYADDNSPTVLPDGRVVSLWLESATGNGLHEIKLMSPTGQNPMVLTSTNSPFVEVDDVGLGAGPLWAPLLTIAPAGGAVNISWPARFTNVTLQASGQLATPSWASLTTTTNSLTLPTTNTARFFRLVKGIN